MKITDGITGIYIYNLPVFLTVHLKGTEIIFKPFMEVINFRATNVLPEIT